MDKKFPDHIDPSLVGFGVTYWADKDHKYLIQFSRSETAPCFEVIKGHRRQIQPTFEPDLLYGKCLRSALSHEQPQAETTTSPSLSIGLAFDGSNLYSRIGINEATLKNQEVAGLRSYLDEFLGRS